MKYIYLILPIILVAIPISLLAHSNDADSVTTGNTMMHEIEDRMLGDEEHEDHEQLMIKMMSGENLSEGEIQEMIDFMDTNPGVHSMMMNRLDGNLYGRHMNKFSGNNYSHMFGGTYGLTHGITMLLVWGILGLSVVALGKHVLKK
jgi:hypothetical protein